MSALLSGIGPVAASALSPAVEFVAVSGSGGVAADVESPAQRERRAVERRLKDSALRAVATGTPVLVLPLLMQSGVAAVLAGGPSGLGSWSSVVAWSGVVLLLGLGWMSMAWAAVHRATWVGDTRRQRRMLAVCGACCAAASLLLASLSASAVALCMLAALAPIAAVVLVPMRESWTAIVLWAVAPATILGLREGLGGPAGPWPLAGCVAFSASALLVALWRSGQWEHDQRAVIQRDDQLREMAAARDAARRAEQEKTRFLATASHDLRQPMHALGLFAATLEKRLHGAPEEPLVQNVMRSIEGLDRSFNVMLDISRLDAGTVEPNVHHFPLRDLFRRLHMQYIGQAEQAGLGLRFSAGCKSVRSDPQLLERILGNLIQNAIKYTERGGIAVVARSTSTHVNVEVWDTGVGIAPADLPRVFEEFCQVGRYGRVRAQGLGMGLAIVKRLAGLLGHRLTVRSRPGGGTMFRVGIAMGELPGIEEETVAADTLPMPVLQPCSVLVIDDEAPIRDALRLLLEEWGYDVVCAATTHEAERTVRSRAMPPDLILSDLHLGPGPDGIAAIDAVRRAYGYEVPAILVTGDTSHDEMRRATDSGHTVLFKPLQPRKLFNALHGLAS
ncbi:hybrid sensor histidine kinase/response regulator [Ideonella sp. DXS29W]|uniref:histidine kinase n=1 Tax=Ideonella lacteola TaxID=2984193 RepID=A0ABU9BXY1_9BURK